MRHHRSKLTVGPMAWILSPVILSLCLLMSRHLWNLEDVEGEDADEVTVVDEESSEDNEDPSYAFNLSPVFAPVTIKFYRSSELQQCVRPISRIYSAT
jgi:hypothetical protein